MYTHTHTDDWYIEIGYWVQIKSKLYQTSIIIKVKNEKAAAREHRQSCLSRLKPHTYMHTQTCPYTHAHTYIHKHIYTYSHTNTCTYTQGTHTYMHTHAHIHKHTHIHTHTCTHKTSTRTHVCTYIRVVTKYFTNI